MGSFFANTLRQNNQVYYKTPNMGGLTASLAWAMGEVAGTSSGSRTLGGNVELYKNGPLYVGVGFSDQKNAAASGLPTSSSSLVASYNFGVAYAGLTYIENKDTAGNKTKPLISASPCRSARLVLVCNWRRTNRGSAKAQTFGLLWRVRFLEAYQKPMPCTISARTRVWSALRRQHHLVYRRR